jgi:hypothetical protein
LLKVANGAVTPITVLERYPLHRIALAFSVRGIVLNPAGGNLVLIAFGFVELVMEIFLLFNI